MIIPGRSAPDHLLSPLLLFTYINQLFAYANRTQDQETADLAAPTRFFITFFSRWMHASFSTSFLLSCSFVRTSLFFFPQFLEVHDVCSNALKAS
jgi:hypothetical protein